MTKDEFLKKHGFTELDYRNLIRFEAVRRSGQTNMYDYLIQMITYNSNGGERLAVWTAKAGNYEEFLSTLGKKKENDK